MGSTVLTAVQLTTLRINKTIALTRSKMASYENNENNLVTCLSSLNQVFLTCLLVNIIIANCLGRVQINNMNIADDHDFELDTTLECTKNHSTVVAGLVALSVAAAVAVSASRVLQNTRRLNISIFDIVMDILAEKE